VADLVESAVSDPPASARPGGNFAVTDTVLNEGNAAAGASTTLYYLSLDTVKSNSDTALTGSRSVPSLEPGAVSTGTISVTIGTKTATGTYYVLACADAKNHVAESNETNNCRSSAGTVAVGP
jgi:subtilase family serine protease